MTSYSAILLKKDGEIKTVTVENDETHIILGGPVTFVGALLKFDAVAIANRELPLTENNKFCGIFNFEDTSSDILVVETNSDGNPTNASDKLTKKIYSCACFDE